MRIEELPTPSLLLDLDVVERNLETMAAKSRSLGVALRPHAKTHKCAELAARQLAAGATGLTVSTLAEAETFAAIRATDLTWAFPLIPSRVDHVTALIRKGVRLRLVVDSMFAVERLAHAALDIGDAQLDVLIKVDCGYHRAGVDPETARPLELARKIADDSKLRFDGILSHSGHAYDVRGAGELAAIAELERSVMVDVAEQIRAEGIGVPTVSVGSTPSMSAVRNLDGITEVRPGNYVFYDAGQLAIGSCRLVDCGLTVLTTVVSKSGSHSVIDAGALTLSKDTAEGAHAEVMTDLDGSDLGQRVVSVSQEHGIVSESIAVGTLLRILPAHSCLAAACFDHYMVVRGREVVDQWKIDRRR